MPKKCIYCQALLSELLIKQFERNGYKKSDFRTNLFQKQKRSVNASNVKDIRQEEVDVALDLLKEEKKFKILEHHLRLEKLKSDVSINHLKIDLLKRCYDGLKFDIGQS